MTKICNLPETYRLLNNEKKDNYLMRMCKDVTNCEVIRFRSLPHRMPPEIMPLMPVRYMYPS